jgi:hypothetical protein
MHRTVLVARNHRHLRNIDCLTARTACLVMNVSFVSCRSRKKKKRRLFCAALVAGTVNKLEQSILRLRYLCSQLIHRRVAHNYKYGLRTLTNLFINIRLRALGQWDCTVVGHLPHQPKVEGLSPIPWGLYYKTFYGRNSWIFAII